MKTGKDTERQIVAEREVDKERTRNGQKHGKQGDGQTDTETKGQTDSKTGTEKEKDGGEGRGRQRGRGYLQSPK